MDRRKVLIGAAVGAIIIALAIVLLQPRAAWFVIPLVVIFGSMIYPMYALAVAHANDFAKPDEFVKIAGGLLLLLGFGTMFGPILAAELMTNWRPEGLFLFAATVHALIVLYTLFRMSRRQAPVREGFQGIPLPKVATPEASILDPRSTEETGPDPASPAAPAATPATEATTPTAPKADDDFRP
jgi:MFS family permease